MMGKRLKISQATSPGKFVAVKPVFRKAVASLGEDIAVGSPGSGLIVRDPKTGQLLTVKGAGGLKGSSFAIQTGVDLTKPIAEQALRGGAKRAG